MVDSRPPAWRLSLVWHDTVLDTVTVTERQRSIALRTGDTITVVVGATDDGTATIQITGDRLEATLVAGQRLILPAGHELLAELEAAPAPVAVGALAIDSTFLHSGMVAVAMTICAVSALWLHPTAGPGDPGAGLSSDSRRWLALPGGTAHVVARPTFQASGRPLDLGERFELHQQQGEPPAASHTTRRPTLESTLAAMKAALRGNSDSQAHQRDALGEAVRLVAAAPVLGAGVGGLSPKDPVETGVGAGVIGAGDDRRLEALRREQARAEDLPLPPKRIYPVTVETVPGADVKDDGAINATPELDPMVREHLTRMIRSRHNVIRSCYEAWGLAGNARRSGRLVLSLTLRPDGRVQDLDTTVTDAGLERVGRCIERAANEWYLGDGLVDQPTRLAFPFNLQPRQN